ncbi:OLC1v1037358C2 [Oldenlandia corymbosa var. corymbosa]|uniref:OLC1v1037358C2 n=1 Tax=Oldenlandia corymbosa var. corymbosa TaxID=529605 RepID=A0AAV1CXJ4_OLDCO|nr:OLC1v1037358C2 [Oldenlandia corymbosa var. corymbosa]
MAAVVTAAAVCFPSPATSSKPSATFLSTTNCFLSSERITFKKVPVHYRKNVYSAGGKFIGKCLPRRAPTVAVAALNEDIWGKINEVNQKGPYFGLVVPNNYEMNPLLQSPKFVLEKTLDFAGRRFRIGKVADKSVIIVMTGLGMLNAGVTTQLLASLFNIKGILHHGIAGNANPDLQIGDVTIAKEWAHTGLWNWQRFGDGPENELALEANGDYTREVGYLNISDFNSKKEVENSLNKIWYQPEEIFPIDGTIEERQHAFWVPVDEEYYSLAKKLEVSTIYMSPSIIN